MNRSRRCSGDGGASLLIVTVALGFLAVLVTSLLAVGDVSFRSAGAYRELSESNYAADAAVDYAVAALQKDRTIAVGGPCPALAPLAIDGRTVTVRCEKASPGSGAGNADRPVNALLALATTGNGVLVNDDQLLVEGSVYSHSTIAVETVPGAELIASGTVTAPSCTAGRVTGEAGTACASAGTADGTDPGWSSIAGSTFSGAATKNLTALLPAERCLTTLANPKYTVALLEPGKYGGNLKAQLESGCPGVDGVLFQPGVHYLENMTGFNGLDIVAGTPGPWLGLSAPPRDGSACVYGSAGTQLLLGDGTTINLSTQNTTMTLCPPTSGTPISLYGVTSTADGLRAQPLEHPALITDQKPDVFIHGTVYLPSASIRVALLNKTKTSYARGIVTRRITVDAQASFKGAEPVSLPACAASGPNACGGDRHLRITATTGGQDWLRAVVRFDDDSLLQPGRASVESWVVTQ